MSLKMMMLAVVMMVVPAVLGAITVTPADYIGQKNGNYPQVFSGYSWDKAKTYKMQIYVSDKPIEKICQIDPTTATNLNCNTGGFSTLYNGKPRVVLQEDGAQIWAQNTTVGTFTKAFQYVYYWPVSAPANTPTVINFNISVDSNSLSGYALDTTGTAKYKCVWYVSTSTYPWLWTNYGSAFSDFTPVNKFQGWCKTPALGDVTLNPKANTDGKNAALPIQTYVYLVGTDGLAGQLSPVCADCNQQTQQEFEFTVESYDTSNDPALNFRSTGVTPNIVGNLGMSTFTIAGSNFASTYGPNNVRYAAYVKTDLFDKGYLGGSEAKACTITSTALICPGPNAFTDGSGSTKDVNFDIMLTRGDDAFVEYGYRMAQFNITYAAAYTSSVYPLSTDKSKIQLGPGSRVNWTAKTFFAPANYTCRVIEGYTTVLLDIPGVRTDNKTVTCTMPKSITGVANKDVFRFSLVGVTGTGGGDWYSVGRDSSMVPESATWSTSFTGAATSVFPSVAIFALAFVLAFVAL